MNGWVRKCHNRSLTQQPTSKLTTVVHMVGEQSAYEGNGQRRGKKVALDQSEAYDVAFQKVKNHFSEVVCLRYFNTIKDVVLQVDAFQVGPGEVLLPDGKPVAYASKALIPAEERYANTERKPCSSVVCLKYHHYLYGRRFVCKSDHQHQENSLKNLSDAPPRLQRLLLNTSK